MNDFLLQSYLRSVVLGLVGLVAAYFVRRKSASVQHLVLVCCLVAILAIPVIRLAVPEQPLAVFPPIAEVNHVRVVSKLSHLDKAASEPTHEVDNVPSISLDPWLMIWLLGVGLILGRYGFGLTIISRWIRQGKSLGITAGGPQLVSSDSVGVPMTAWLGRHYVFVPSSWDSWTSDRRESALQHELAHVRRGDWFAQMGCQIICGLFWGNPLVWILCRRSRTLAEQAADDMVLACGVSPTQYAQDLLEIARETKATFPELAVCMAQGMDVARRIEMILRERTKRGAVSKTGMALSVLVAGSLTAPVACMAFTHRTEALLRSPVSLKPVNKAPVQIRVECEILNAGVMFADSGLTPSHAGSKTVVESGSKGEPAFLEITDKKAKELIGRWKKSGSIATSPRIFTRSGTAATLNIDNGTNSFKITVNPTYQSANSIMMNVEVEGKYVTVEPNKPTVVNTYTEATSFSIRPGANVVLTKYGIDGHEGELLGLLKVEVLDRVGP